MMARAFTLMRKKAVIYATDETIEQIAKDYEEAMKEAAEASSKVMKGNKYALGYHHSEEALRKMREVRKGNKHALGCKRSEEAKKKLREINKGNKRALGYHHTEEAKKKIKEVHKGKPLSAEHKNKLSEAKKGMRFFNNGEKCVRAKECPPGFTPGRIK